VRPNADTRALAGISVTPQVGDLTDTDSLRRALEGVEVVYNIAALYREAGRPVAEYRAVNAVAVGQIVELAKTAGARRVVHCSTVGVHGDVEHPPASEEAPLRPGDVYQATKLEGEQIGQETARRVGMELVIARPSGIYGPNDRRLFKIFGAVAQRRFVMLGSGANYYHVTYIDDLCAGFMLCGRADVHPGRRGGDDAAAAGRSHGGGGQGAAAAVAVSRLARVGGGRAVRGRVRAVRDLAAALPAACRLLPQEPGVRHQSRAAGARVSAARRRPRRHRAHAGVVP
jgi:nucleoside-diphosphate-sugar epimerase